MSTLRSGRVRVTDRVFQFMLIFVSLLITTHTSFAQTDCSACAVFPSVTVYHSIQSGPGNGIGFEVGTWKKEKGSVSYFFGSSLVWQAGQSGTAKSGATNSNKPVSMSMYIKGQVALGDKLYAVLQPGIQDLSFFTLKAGVRYVIPLSNRVGLGLEPNYSIFQNVLAFNTNLHIALR